MKRLFLTVVLYLSSFSLGQTSASSYQPSPKPTAKPLREDFLLFDLVEQAFKVLNATNPKATESSWLCYDSGAPYYEGVAFTRTVSQTEDISQCRWQQGQNVRVTLSVVTGQGTCIGKIPPSQKFLCNQTLPTPLDNGYLLPPTEGWWACSSGLTPCVNLQVLRDTQDFCVLVQLVPRLIYHPFEELLSHWDSRLPRSKRELIGIKLSDLLGLRAADAALVIRGQNFRVLQAAIHADIQELGNISELQESLTSLSEVALQNKRRLALLFLHQRGLCVVFREECCFYIDHSGVVKDSMARVRERLAERKKEREEHQGWYESWYNSSPWLTTLISAVTGPLVILLLLLIFLPCILNRFRTFVRERISTAQVMMLRQQYQGLRQNEV